MPSVDIEPQWRDWVSAGDVDRIAGLVADTGFFNREEQEIAVELVADRLERGTASGYDFLLAEIDGSLTGYACFGHTPGTASSYDLYWIVVAPAQQRCGLGTRLLAEVESRIRRVGGSHVWIDTSGREQYHPTRAFYLARGYQVAARLIDFYAVGDDKLILSKALTRDPGPHHPGI